MTVSQIVDRIVEKGLWPQGYKAETMSKALSALQRDSLVDSFNHGVGQAIEYWAI
jgi:hypothetical protein